jgi:hypothetical protein
MLTQWNKILTADCEVIEIGSQNIYPIFRVGYTSLMETTEKVYTNNEITTCKDVTVLIRDPAQRFVSGVNEYCRTNNLDLMQTHSQIKNGSLVDRHFVPQWFWILHLYKFYRGSLMLRPFSDISDLTKIHRRKDEPKQQVPLLREFIDQDYVLIEKYMNTTLDISELVKEYRNVLS